MSVAGWQEGIAQTLHVHCNGGATFYGRRFGCWVKGGHGEVSLEKAIYQSCDVFFYTLAEKLGIDRIAKYATALGLGQKTGIDLPNEVSGVMPSEEWKIRNFKQKWFAGETISVGIGQGAIAITPVQLMRAVGAISMDGRMVVPHVINPAGSAAGIRRDHALYGSEEHSDRSDGWTFITDAHVAGPAAGRHGSFGAHSGNRHCRQDRVGADCLAGHCAPSIRTAKTFAQNGWFVGFTPRRNPDIIVCVLFEGGEHGRLAARLATQVIKAYVDKQRRQPTKMAASQPKVEIGAMWSEPGAGEGESDNLQGGRFVVDVPRKTAALGASPPQALH